MLTKSSARIVTAIVDAVVSTLTALLPLVISDPRIVQVVIPLIASYQVIAGTIIAALTVDVTNEARIVSSERIAALNAHMQRTSSAEEHAAFMARWQR